MKRLFGCGEALVLDGAMGTELINRGLTEGQSSFMWSSENPRDILAIHGSYVQAGADYITTNTFGGSPLMLDRMGLGSRFTVLNRLAVELAIEASQKSCGILGDIGPCGDFLEPIGDLTEEKLIESVQTQAEILASAGVNAFIVETMSDVSEMTTTIRALQMFQLPILTTFTYELKGGEIRTLMGVKPAEATRAAMEAGAFAVGANCGSSLSLDDYKNLAADILAEANGLPVLMQPNAGTPTQAGGKFSYGVTPEDFGAWAQIVHGMGVQIIGGCCGTTPRHIENVSNTLKTSSRSE